MGNIFQAPQINPLGSTLARQKVGKLTQLIQEFIGSTSYATNGDTLLAQSLGLVSFAAIDSVLDYSNTYRISPLFSGQGKQTSVKLVFYKLSDGTQPTSTTDLSAIKFRLNIFGSF